jgi:hypothetical protein
MISRLLRHCDTYTCMFNQRMALKMPKHVPESCWFIKYYNKVVLDYILLHYLINNIGDVEPVRTKVLVPSTDVLSHLNDIVLHETEWGKLGMWHSN